MRCSINRLPAGVLALFLGVAAPAAASDTPIKAVATIPAAHSVLAGVMGEDAAVHLLIRGAASPHAYSLKPSDAAALAEADLVVWVGPGLETFLDGRLETLAPRARIVEWEDVPGIVTYPVRGGEDWSAHGHDDGHDDGHDHGDAHGHDHGDAHGHDHGGADAHLWLDPRNGVALAGALAAELGALAPARAETFQANATSYGNRIEAADAAIAARLAPLTATRFLVFHDAFQYFERRYGLSGAGSITLSPEVSAGAARVREIRDRIAAGGIACVFAEPQFRPDLVDTLVEGTTVRAGTLDPVGANLDPGPDLYPALLTDLAEDMATCLGG